MVGFWRPLPRFQCSSCCCSVAGCKGIPPPAPEPSPCAPASALSAPCLHSCCPLANRSCPRVHCPLLNASLHTARCPPPLLLLILLWRRLQPFEGRTEAQVLQLVAAGHRPPLTRYLAGEGSSVSLTSSAGSIFNNSNTELTSPTGGAGAPLLVSGGSFGAAVELLVPPPLANIIECCWDQDPARRPTFSQVITGLEAAAVALQLKLD